MRKTRLVPLLLTLALTLGTAATAWADDGGGMGSGHAPGGPPATVSHQVYEPQEPTVNEHASVTGQTYGNAGIEQGWAAKEAHENQEFTDATGSTVENLLSELDSGDAAAALQQAQGVLTAHPHNFAAWQLKGEALLKLGEDAAALSSLEQALANNPYLPLSTYAQVGGLLNQQGQTGIKVFVQGSQPSFPVAPFIEHSRTMVPLAVVEQTLGAQVSWNGSTRTVTIATAGGTVQLTIDSRTAVVDGTGVTLDAAPTIVDSRTIVPLYFLSQVLGDQVQWDGTSRTVVVTQ